MRGERAGDDVYLHVIDNGLGMPEEKVAELLSGDSAQREESSSRHGNGVGLYNVHTRIQLRFGKEYGLVISHQMVCYNNSSQNKGAYMSSFEIIIQQIGVKVYKFFGNLNFSTLRTLYMGTKQSNL